MQSSATTLAEPKKNQVQKKDSFFLKAAYKPYISEITSKLRSIFILFVIASVLGFIYYQKILSFFIGLFHFEGINLVLTSPYQFLDLSIQTALITGIVVTSPLFLFHLIQFIKPALQPHEFKLIVRLLPLAAVLFVAGFAFGVWVIQFVITLFTETTTQLAVSNIWDVSNFFSQLLITGISLALVFQMPIVITTLLRLKVLTHKAISSKRRIVYVAIFILAALLPPTDIISLLLLAIVPLFLFESALLFNQPTRFALGH
jgi:sec-independent protein translocase protein TatC